MMTTEINKVLREKLDMPIPFRCPKCSGAHFGTNSYGQDKGLYIKCHDQYDRRCNWTGQWSEVETPDYCGDIWNAWLIQEKMRNRGYDHFGLNCIGNTHWAAKFTCGLGPCERHGNPYSNAHYGASGECDTAEMAICVAAMNALTLEEGWAKCKP